MSLIVCNPAIILLLIRFINPHGITCTKRPVCKLSGIGNVEIEFLF